MFYYFFKTRTVGERVFIARELAGLSQSALANKIGVSRSAISQLESNPTGALKAANLIKAADVLGVQPRWLESGQEPMYPPGRAPNVDHLSDDELKEIFKAVESTKSGAEIREIFIKLKSNVSEAPELRSMNAIPVVGRGKGGHDGYFFEEEYPVGQGSEFITFPTKDSNAFALRVVGDSMAPRFKNNEFVIVEPNSQAVNGDDVYVVLRNGRKLLKELAYIRDNEVKLLSVNAKDFEPITLLLEEIDSIYRIGGSLPRGSGFQRG